MPAGRDLPGILVLAPRSLRSGIEQALAERGEIRSLESVGAFLEALAEGGWGIAFLSFSVEPVDEPLVERLAGEPGMPPLVLTTPELSVERVLAAERVGAVGLLAEPPEPSRLLELVGPLLDERGEVPIPEPPEPGDRELVVGSSEALIEAYRVVARVAASAASVLITGESGTGKELVARALHTRSDRREGPFVAINCAAIPETLLEAELFGYERGAFTGAVGRSDGRFGRADGGTLFLDEIGEMPSSLQAKLLRALESGEIERLGGGDPARVDVRFVAATNRDLPERVREGRFREDLFWRFAVVQVDLPPLRDRPEDILPLALHFAADFGRKYDRPPGHLSRAAVDRLGAHRWPGNVRELRNVMDRAVLLSRGGVIRSADLQLGASAPRTSPLDEAPEEAYPPTLSLREVEAHHIRRVLEHTGGHMGDAAEILGVHRNTMTVKVREYGIDPRNPGNGGRNAQES